MVAVLTKIISGGQTGADRTALDAGLELGFPIGGSCPVGRLAEDGPLDDRYKLEEIGGGYRQRTKRNVLDSSGTVIFYESALLGGSQATLLFCIKYDKPYKLIGIEVVSTDLAVKLLRRFISEFDIRILNVAGPRASTCSGVYPYVKTVMGNVISHELG